MNRRAPLLTLASALALPLALAAACGGSTETPVQPQPAVQEPAPPPEPVKPAPPPEAPPAQLHGYMASENGFLVDSYAVVDSGEILLIDAQLIKPDAEKFIEMVKGLEGKVTTIFITHPHPDHYMGLEWVTAAFPEAKVVAMQDTVDAIAKDGAATLKGFKSKKVFGGALAPYMPSKVVTPEPIEGESIHVGQTELRILSFPDAESKMAHALFDEKSASLLTGDLAYDKVHLWLKETPPKGWIAAIEELKKLQPQRVFPGHGEPGGPELLDADLQYLQDFQAAVDASKKQKELKKAVTEKYADWRLPAIVDLAAPSYFKK